MYEADCYPYPPQNQTSIDYQGYQMSNYPPPPQNTNYSPSQNPNHRSHTQGDKLHIPNYSQQSQQCMCVIV